ncbi:hypothetical protein G7Y89_g10221 [Cudoniella acicularis]|uniref:F-box domain-containing protein n=1 Tax=Cudoniella acicularis TaxID=354080 RepID=A0A8H4W1U7_9HELO|nr:hypothetical protein G7Y89_g10221 [Cudoniella acicularis]
MASIVGSMGSRKRKDSNSILLSQRSNGLLFSHHHFLSASSGPAQRRQQNSVLSQIDGNAPAGPRPKMVVPLTTVSESGWMSSKDDFHLSITTRQPVRSLIPPVTPARYKTAPSIIRRRRNSSSSTSIKSMTSSMLSRRRKSAMVPIPSLANMPSEILSQIFSCLPQRELHALMLTNSNFVEVAATYLYASPTFVSTYRFAQFVWEVAHKSHYALMVHELDLSYFSKLSTDPVTGELMNQAGWREFKYRHHDMYFVRSFTPGQKSSSHPPASPFLKSYHRTRDVPIGGLCHVLSSCLKLRKLNLSRVQLAADFLVRSPLFKSDTTEGLLFVSDVPKSWTWASSDLTPVYADEVVRWVLMRGERMRRDRGLSRVDFRESGMTKDIRWAVKGTRDEVEKIVKEVVENTKEVTP